MTEGEALERQLIEVQIVNSELQLEIGRLEFELKQADAAFKKLCEAMSKVGVM